MNEQYKKLKELVEQYILKRTQLVQSYNFVKYNSTILKYQARELFISLYSTADAAQKCEQYYKSMNMTEISEEEQDVLKKLFNEFEKDARENHIKIQAPNFPNPRVTYNRDNEAFNARNQAKNLLPLMPDVLSGLSKMTYALYGSYVDINIVSIPFYLGMMNVHEELKLDYNIVLGNREILTHIFFHEVGHADDFQFKGVATKPQNTIHLSYVNPSVITQSLSSREKTELTADFFAAIGFAIFDIPYDMPLSMMQQLSSSQEKKINEGLSVQHTRYLTRAMILQEVIPTLKAQFYQGNSSNLSRWGNLATWFKERAQMNYTDLPSQETLLSIANKFSGNLCRQRIELSKYSRNLYESDLDNNYPIAAKISVEVLNKIEKENENNQFKRATYPVSTSPNFIKPNSQSLIFPRIFNISTPKNSIIFNPAPIASRPITRLQQQISPLFVRNIQSPTPQLPTRSGYHQPLLFSEAQESINGTLALGAFAGYKIFQSFANCFSRNRF